jgi:hypothetical protein
VFQHTPGGGGLGGGSGSHFEPLHAAEATRSVTHLSNATLCAPDVALLVAKQQPDSSMPTPNVQSASTAHALGSGAACRGGR